MCGIAGFSGDFAAGLLEKMNSIQAHRGPDGSGVFYDPGAGVGLAHRRLAIIDLSEFGSQPMWDETKRLCIVFNGEIFNFRELRNDLERDGFHFRSTSDTEVILQLFRRHGEAMLPKLNGQFTFALWDAQQRRMLIARDGMGVKPLYYTMTQAGLLFASELKALLCEETVDRSLDMEAIHYDLTYLWSPAPHTMLQSVRKLRPGHAMSVKAGVIEREWCFYRLPYDQPIASIPPEEAACQVRAAIATAVKRQMIADVPVGAFLSGGLDSSSVVAFAREYSHAKLQCFTIDFRGSTLREEGMVDDLPYARRVADHLDVDLHTIEVGPEMATEFEEMVYHLDEPQADPAPLNVLFISRLARKNGIKVLLSGAGGDDIFTGYRRHYALMLERYWAWLPLFLREGLRKMSARLPQQTSYGRRLSKVFRYGALQKDERLASYFFWSDPSSTTALYGPALEGLRVNSSEPLMEVLRELDPATPGLNRMLALEQKFFLADHNLNYTDKLCMAAGVEGRVPLLDPDLVSFAARLPLEYKQRHGTGKWIFKKAMESTLPRDVIYRPKTGFGVPLRRWMRNELRPLVEELLSPHSLRSRGLFDVAGVAKLVADDRAGRVDGTYTILSLMCIEIWCRRFLSVSAERQIVAAV